MSCFTCTVQYDSFDLYIACSLLQAQIYIWYFCLIFPCVEHSVLTCIVPVNHTETINKPFTTCQLQRSFKKLLAFGFRTKNYSLNAHKHAILLYTITIPKKLCKMQINKYKLICLMPVTYSKKISTGLCLPL